jgi:hypothetical protein
MYFGVKYAPHGDKMPLSVASLAAPAEFSLPATPPFPRRTSDPSPASSSVSSACAQS